ncbi:MAG: tyrosine-type recombinase/integrase [Acidimicrobiales bacterium]
MAISWWTVRGTKRKRREGVWEVRAYLGRDPITGKPRQISKTVYGGAKVADEALRDLIEKRAPRADGMGASFGQLLDRWLTECERLDLSPTTMRTYRAQIEQTIRPALGKVSLTRLSAKYLDDLYGAMKAAGKTPKTIRNHHAIISAALHQATRWGWVRTNVAEMAKPPRIAQRRVKAPSVDVVRSIIESAEERDPRLAALLMLGALTGMRRGELCGLRWSDVDFDRAELEVSRSVIVVPGGLSEKSTKTDRVRPVALDEVGVALLVEYRARVDKWAGQAGATVNVDAYVFSPYVDGSSPFRPDNVTGFFIRVRDSLGLDGVRLHDLRHFTATQLIGAGVDVRTVAERLGHSDASLTLRVYAHVIRERDRAAAEVIGRVLGPVRQPIAELEPVE